MVIGNEPGFPLCFPKHSVPLHLPSTLPITFFLTFFHIPFILCVWKLLLLGARYRYCLVTQSCPTLCDLVDSSPPGSSVPFSRQEYWSGLPCSPPGDLPTPGIKPRSPALQLRFLSEPPGKPKNARVGSLSFSGGSS